MPVPVPLAVSLAGRRVVVVGGGRVAAAKASPLLAAGADVLVVAPDVVPELHTAALLRRAYAGGDDLAGAWLAVAATGVPDVDDRVVSDAEAQRIWCVRSGSLWPADSRPEGSVAFMAALRRGPLVVAAASGAPALTRHVRQRLEEVFGPEYAQLAQLFADLRRDPDIRARLRTLPVEARQAAWRSIPVADILALLRQGAFDAATELATACLSSSSG